MHHANLLVGSETWAYTHISLEDRTPGLDVVVYDEPSFTIAHARALMHEASMKPALKEYRVFIIVCDSILHEAQNALLKLFEEPNPGTIFYLVLREEDLLLPTLRSRLHVLAREGDVKEDAVFEDFRKASYKERLERIQEKLSSEDVSWVDSLMLGMEVYAHKHHDPRLMREVLRTVSYLRAPGSSKKMLLEHLALSL